MVGRLFSSGLDVLSYRVVGCLFASRTCIREKVGRLFVDNGTVVRVVHGGCEAMSGRARRIAFLHEESRVRFTEQPIREVAEQKRPVSR